MYTTTAVSIDGRERRHPALATTWPRAAQSPPRHAASADQVHQQPQPHAGRRQVEPAGAEEARRPSTCRRAITLDGHEQRRERQQQRPRQQPMARHRPRQLEIDQPGLHFVRGLGRQVHRDAADQHADDRMEVAERDRALERREEHRLAAEAALQESGQQIRHPAERLRALDLRRLPDDDDLEPAEQRRTRRAAGSAPARRTAAAARSSASPP